MSDTDLLLLKGGEIDHLLASQETAIMAAVGAAYQAHARGQTGMPPDSYLRFPGLEKERIISKAAYLGGDFDVAGIKWIASFPSNVEKGMERASATLILNSTETGRPMAIMESSLISAKRTAASAALGAKALCPRDDVTAVGLVGCGMINFEILRFLLTAYPSVHTVHVFDLSAERATQFAGRAGRLKTGLRFDVATSLDAVLAATPLVSLATTAVVPHITSPDACSEGAVLLHISLRDLSADIILAGDNVVDDFDKVCSNNTSLHLAQLTVGHRDFIRTTIGDHLNGHAPPAGDKPYAIYSPFGLGILDLALAHLVYREAQAQSVGTAIDHFLPPSWLER
ncbi:MAG: 2,3-diaminopropionate biosynthesis protein SbnB [Bacteroidota bacterium]